MNRGDRQPVGGAVRDAAARARRWSARTYRTHDRAALRAVGSLVPRSRRRTDAAAPLRLLAHVGEFLPQLRGGSEVSLKLTLDALAARGHEVTIVVDDPRATTGIVEGVPVVAAPSLRETLAAYRRSDVVLTQIDARYRAMRLAAFTGRPVVHLVHMSREDLHTFGPPDLRVFAAGWLAAAAPQECPSLVLHPLIDPERYRVEPGEAVTLVNLNRAKGAELFYRLAEAMPEQPFLGVLGGWGEQIVPTPLPPNVEIMTTSADVRDVFRRTRVLVVPSDAELLARVPLEAACSGIPTVATPVAGVREGLADAALYAAPDDVEAWVGHLRALRTPEAYGERSRRARERFARFCAETDGELDRFEAALRGLATGGSR